MICSIMQPTFLPWLGYFDLIDCSDKFIFYDNVQLAKRSWQVRNRIKTSNGELFLTVPILKTGNRDDILIKDATIDYSTNWREKYMKSIEMSYKKAPYFDEIFLTIKALFDYKHERLVDMNTSFITDLCQKMDINTEFCRSSELSGIEGTKDLRLVNICKSINCSKYLSPLGSSQYIEKDTESGEFNTSGVELLYQSYVHPVYRQLYDPFIPYMSILDLICNEGFKHSIIIIRSGRNEYLKSNMIV